jgi:hypothetical protein
MPEQKISRVLFPAKGGAMIIYLGLLSPKDSSDLPGSNSPATGGRTRRAASPSLCGLALRWGLPGPVLPRERVVSYTAFSPLPFSRQRRDRGGLFSVALSVPYGPTSYVAPAPAPYGARWPWRARTFLPSPAKGEGEAIIYSAPAISTFH